MRLTNVLALPAPLYRAVLNDDYSRGDSDISVTQLIDPARKVALINAHAEEIVEDASDRIWALFGKVVHKLLEKDNFATVVEGRLYMQRLGWTVSGQIDRMVLFNGVLQDWKTTSVFSVKDGHKLDWEQQLNCYAHLGRENGWTVRDLQVFAILRDWRKAERLRDVNYPANQVARMSIPLWKPDFTENFIKGRVRLHQEARELITAGKPLPLCTAEERWAEPDRFAVKKEGNKRAVRVLDTQAEAQRVLEAEQTKAKGPAEAKKLFIEHRRGGSRRCADYCTAAPFCEQWAAEQAEKEEGTDHDE